MNRRSFLQSLGGGVLILSTCEIGEAQESGRSGHGRTEQSLPEDIAAWLHIAPDNAITVFTGKVEVGQNIRTSLTQAVADELRCTPASIKLVMGDTALVPWDMGTFGSRTTPTMAPVLRKMAATARETLIDAAAKQWNLDRSSLSAKDGCIANGASGKRASFGELASTVDWVHAIGKDDCVTPPAKWQVAGTSIAKVNAREIVTGNHKYTSDHKLAGMLYGRVLRPPSFGAKIISVDIGAAVKIPGVIVVRDSDFVGVIAPDEHIATKAIASITAKWDEQTQVSAADLVSYLKTNSTQSDDGRGAAARGSVEQGFEAAHKTLQAEYTVAYIAHAPLEPRAAVAEWKDGKLTVWTGTQRPFGVRTQLAETFGLSEDRVRVLMPDTGSAYGGKHTGECAIEAARLAKAAGIPVKLIWTREEEFIWAYFRPAG
ncbi:MAG: xanthine dehydrogenase family protein molybdopterin-binding subunit, partial [Acidobacteriaceae bacterium]|nr:xanthine dehydrogenase family protein molybdopterin-binding subunit [Acidobacteriaceae bacterium]